MLLRLLPDRLRSQLARSAVRRSGGGLLATALAVSVLVPVAASHPALASTTTAQVAKEQLLVTKSARKAHKKARHAFFQRARHRHFAQRERAFTLLALVNAAREQGRRCGTTYYRQARPLRYNDNLSDAARKFARDLGRHEYFSHVGRSGSTPTSRARAEGFRGLAGENIAAGRSSARATMRDWMNSPGHCANIMSRQYRYLGIGYAAVPGSPYRTYWVQDFGLR